MGGALAERTEGRASQWFESWFDSEHYHRLYAYRNEAEASAFIDRLIERLDPAAGSTALDLGCGAGRHARQLASRGFDVTGIDLSQASIEAAKREEHPRLRFLRRDMRVPFGTDAFDYLFNFFTSFGYFDAALEHQIVIANMARSLKLGGRLVLDYLNVHYAESHSTAEEVRELDGGVYRITRWSDARHFYKRIVVEERRDATPFEYVERVAKFTARDFERMLGLCNLAIEQIYGDYQLSTYDAQTSPRLILVARKSGGTCTADYLRDRLLRMRLTVSGETPRYEASIH
jgi:SAM-dependent methyltransferase